MFNELQYFGFMKNYTECVCSELFIRKVVIFEYFARENLIIGHDDLTTFYDRISCIVRIFK